VKTVSDHLRDRLHEHNPRNDIKCLYQEPRCIYHRYLREIGCPKPYYFANKSTSIKASGLVGGTNKAGKANKQGAQYLMCVNLKVVWAEFSTLS
jgi:hypothetical protein